MVGVPEKLNLFSSSPQPGRIVRSVCWGPVCITGVALGTVSVTGVGMAGGKAGLLTQKALECTP